MHDIIPDIHGQGEKLNALHYHARHPGTGEPLRARSAKNTAQHRTFLEAFPPDAPATREVLAWMRRLPLYLETARFRAVHAR